MELRATENKKAMQDIEEEKKMRSEIAVLGTKTVVRNKRPV